MCTFSHLIIIRNIPRFISSGILLLFPMLAYCELYRDQFPGHLKCISENAKREMSKNFKDRKIGISILGPYILKEAAASVELVLNFDNEDLHITIYFYNERSKVDGEIEMTRRLWGDLSGVKIDKNTVGDYYIYKYPNCKGVFDAIFKRNAYAVYFMYHNGCPKVPVSFEQRVILTKKIASLIDKELIKNSSACEIEKSSQKKVN